MTKTEEEELKDFLFRHLEIRVEPRDYTTPDNDDRIEFTVQLCFDGKVIDSDTFTVYNQ